MKHALLLTTFIFCLYCVSAQNVLTGAEIMNKGFDFRNGGVVPNSKLFEYTYARSPRIYSPPGRPDLKFKVPQEIQIVAAPNSREELSSNLFGSYEQITKYDTASLDFGRKIDNSEFGRNARYAPEYAVIQQRIREQFKTMTRSLYFVREYRIASLPYLHMPLDKKLEDLLEALPPAPRTQADLNLYRTIIQNYGAFFQWTGEYGGSIRSFHFMNGAAAARGVNYLKQQTSNSFENEIKGANKPIDPFFTQNMKKETVYTGGQRSANLNQWINSIKQSPGLVAGRFRPISDLVVDSNKKASFEAVILEYAKSGQIKMPFTAALVGNLPKVPGYALIGTGFDPAYMQTRLPIFEHEDYGFQAPNQWRNPFYPQHHYSVPSSVTLFQRTESVETNFTDVFMTRNQFESKFTERTVKKGFFSKRSREVYYYQKRVEELASVRIEMEKQISWYDLKLDPRIYFIPEQSAKYMNPALKHIIDNMLGTNYNDPEVRAMYRQVIEYWGPEFIIGARMGGAYRSEISFEKELLKTYTIDMVKTQSSFSFFGIIKSSKYNFKNDTRIDAWFKEHAKVSLIVKGGRFSRIAPRNSNTKSTDDGFAGFAASVRTDPEALQYDIVPLTVIIRDPVKHQLMTRAIQEYRKELAETSSLNDFTETEKEQQCKRCVCASKCLTSEWQFSKVEHLVSACQKDVKCYAQIVGSKAASCISKC